MTTKQRPLQKLGESLMEGVNTIVLILYGCAEHLAHALRKLEVYLKNNFKFATAVELNECLKLIKLPITLSSVDIFLNYSYI